VRLAEIELWAHRVLDAIAAHQSVEDSRVEVKRTLIEPEKAARQIAGHANAAGGEPILWLLGVDERDGIVGLGSSDELSSWWRSVETHFEALAPSHQDLNIPRDGKSIVAILFDTDRAPFVIKNSDHGKVAGVRAELEVPWREGRMTRSARRTDLLRLLVPQAHQPQIELRAASLYVMQEPGAEDGRSVDWTEPVLNSVCEA
jgi:hypothetical protein